MFSIPKKELSKFRATDREQCGVIVADGNEIVRIIEVENVARSNEDYAITMKDFREIKDALGANLRVLGFFHTHLAHHDPMPSDRDLEGSEIFPDFTNCVYHRATESITWYGILTEEITGVRRVVSNSASSTSVEQGRERCVRTLLRPTCAPSSLMT